MMPHMIPARLLEEVLALPAEERRELALRVLETVEDPVSPEIEEAQYQEVLRIRRLVDAGEMKLIPWREAMAELAAEDP
jgi:hypothetical protein